MIGHPSATNSKFLIMPGLDPGILPEVAEKDARIKCGHDQKYKIKPPVHSAHP